MTHTPTPAEIETLREAVGGCGGSSYTQAIAILDRLSPATEPEVDEATKIWREMRAVGANFVGEYDRAEAFRSGSMDNCPVGPYEIDHLRQTIAELIASKDGEIAMLKAADRDHLSAKRGMETRLTDRAEKAESELTAISAAIGTTEFMDPPDGGSPTLAEQVGRMRAELATLRAENERLHRIKHATDQINVFGKAAERNTAEPEPFKRPTDPADKQWDEWTSQLGTNAGAVEVTEHDHEAWEELRDWRDGSTPRATSLAVIAKVRTEAEARGRRTALDFGENASELYFKALREKWSPVGFFSELKRMMTGGK